MRRAVFVDRDGTMIEERGYLNRLDLVTPFPYTAEAIPDAYYFCPHHPEGIVAAYRVECRCRKPAPGMIEQAVADLDLDVARSFVVGDKWLDVGLANQAGARGILVRTGYGAGTADAPPPGVDVERVVGTLLDAADYILQAGEPGEPAHP